MPLQFQCPHCGNPIILRFLTVGEIAKCKSCGQSAQVPESAQLLSQDEYAAAATQFGSALDHSPIISRAVPNKLMPRSAVLVTAMLYFTAAQLFLLHALYWSVDASLQVLGKDVILVGDTTFEINPPKGCVLITDQPTLDEWDASEVTFIVHGDSLHDDSPVVYGEIYMMEESTTIQKLRDELVSDTTENIVRSRFVNGKLDLVYFYEDEEGDYYFYIRYIPAYPYYLAIYSSFYDGPEPTDEIRNVVRNIKRFN